MVKMLDSIDEANQNSLRLSTRATGQTRTRFFCLSLERHEPKSVCSVRASDDMKQYQYTPSEPLTAYPDNIFRIRCFLKPKKEMKSSITARFTIIKQETEAKMLSSFVYIVYIVIRIIRRSGENRKKHFQTFAPSHSRFLSLIFFQTS